ncbi:hypothetical protein [Parasphingorhabdus pacifica]
MDEQHLREGMRTAVGEEPPLGFDPDELATKAGHARRKRVTALGAGLSTLVVLGLVAVLPAVGGSEFEEVAAASPVVDRSWPMPEWPPSGVEKVRLSDEELWPRAERIRRHLAEIFPGYAPDARNIDVDVTGGVGRLVKAVDKTALHFRLAFADEVGPTEVNLQVYAPGSFPHSPREVCTTGEHARCTVRPQEDGSVFVESESTTRYEGRPVLQTVHQFRPDGTVRFVTAYSYDLAAPDAESGQVRDYPTLSIAQLTKLASDPLLTLDE